MNFSKDQHQHRPGIVLVVVLGVLALLSVLAITFVRLTQLERSVSQNYVDRTRALLTAESGIDYALARIRNFHGPLSGKELAEMSYKDDPSKPGLKYATKVSFPLVPLQAWPNNFSGIVGSSYRNNGDVFKLRVQDESGKLNINDTNGKWNIDTDPYKDNDTPGWYNYRSGDQRRDDEDINASVPRLEKMVEYLVERLFGDPVMPTGIGAEVSIALFEARDALDNRFSDWNQVQDALVDKNNPTSDNPLSLNKFIELKKHITLWSWQDPNVIRPTYQVAISVPEGDTGLPDDNFEIYLFRDAQTREYELEPRCPINLNSCSKELLETVLALLEGWYLYEAPAYFKSDVISYYFFYSSLRRFFYADQLDSSTRDHSLFGKMAKLSLPPHIMTQLVDEIYNRIQDRPFVTWQEFYQFLRDRVEDTLHPDEQGSLAISGFTPAMADLIMAGVNPNSQLNDFNPNSLMFRHVDKAQLSKYTTEFCLEATGVFGIESLGLIHGADGVVAAQSHIKTVIEIFQPFRISSQAQFMQGFDPDDPVKDESGFFSSVDLGIMPTAGARTGNPGYALQSYPEPITDSDSYPYWDGSSDRNYLDDSQYDGYLMFATWQPDAVDADTNFIVDFNRTMRPVLYQAGDEFGHHFIDDIPGNPAVFGIAGVGVAGVGGEGAFDACLEVRNQQVVKANLANIHRLTNVHGSVSGSLYPDGCYSETGRQLRYRATNFGDPDTEGYIGAIELWLKPNFDAAHPSRPRMFLCYPEFVGHMGLGGVSIFYEGGDPVLENAPAPAAFGSGRRCPESRNCLTSGWNIWVYGAYGCLCELGLLFNNIQRSSTTANHRWHAADDEDPSLTRLYQFESRRWNHLALAWNMAQVENNDLRSNFVINGAVCNDTSVGFHPSMPWDLGCLSLLTYRRKNELTGEVLEPAWCSFGGRYGCNTYNLSFHNDLYDEKYQGSFSADSTYDDVIGYKTMMTPGTLALGYTYGRYYNEPDACGILATYTSPEWDLKFRQRVRLRSASWTLWWPEGNRSTDSNEPDLPLAAVSSNTVYPDDPVLAAGEDAIAIDIAADGNWHYKDRFGSAGAALAAMPTYAGGSSCKYENGDAYDFYLNPREETFRFKIHFLLDAGQVVYDAPVLDDVTFCFEYSHPKVYNWRILAE
ncbi:PilX N-terminal domain-containing pilus assembly protein [Planctomycetota bacterium]